MPVTVISTEFTSEMLRNWIEQGEPAVRKFAKIRDVDYVDLPTGHWTQLTRADDPGRSGPFGRCTDRGALGGRAY